MADIAVDRSAQVEAVAAPPRQIAAARPRAHGPCQPRRDGMGLLDLVGVGHVAEIDLGEIVGTRGAIHAAFAGAFFRRILRGWNLVRCGLASAWLGLVALQAFQRRAIGGLPRPPCHPPRFYPLAN